MVAKNVANRVPHPCHPNWRNCISAEQPSMADVLKTRRIENDLNGNTIWNNPQVLRSCIPERHPSPWTYARAYRRARQRSEATSVHIPRAIAQHGTSKTSHMAHFHLRQTGCQATPASPRRARAKGVFLNDLKSCFAAKKDL